MKKVKKAKKAPAKKKPVRKRAKRIAIEKNGGHQGGFGIGP